MDRALDFNPVPQDWEQGVHGDQCPTTQSIGHLFTGGQNLVWVSSLLEQNLLPLKDLVRFLFPEWVPQVIVQLVH